MEFWVLVKDAPVLIASADELGGLRIPVASERPDVGVAQADEAGAPVEP